MKKTALITLFSLIFALIFAFPAFAEGEENIYIIDNADLLTDLEEADVNAKADDLGKRHNIDIIILLDEGLFAGYTDTNALTNAMRAYVESYYEDLFGMSDGLMLLISIDDGYKDYYFYTYGRCHDIIDDYSGMDYIEENVQPYIKRADFYGACLSYIKYSDDLLTDPPLKEGGDYDYDYDYDYDFSELPEVKGSWAEGVPMVIFVSFVIALVAVLIMKSQLKSVRKEYGASDYTVKDSFKVTSAYDLFLYRNVTKTRRETSSSSVGSRSSSGGSRSSGGGGRGGRC